MAEIRKKLVNTDFLSAGNIGKSQWERAQQENFYYDWKALIQYLDEQYEKTTPQI